MLMIYYSFVCDLLLPLQSAHGPRFDELYKCDYCWVDGLGWNLVGGSWQRKLQGPADV